MPHYTEGEIRMATTKKPVAKVAEVKEVKAVPVKAEEVKVEEVKAEVKAEAKKAPAKKAATPKKEAVKKAEVKTEAKKAPAKKAAAPKKEEVKVSVNVQFAGRSLSTADLVKMAKDVWKYDLKQKAADFKSVELYVKPEEFKAYFVINGKEAGSFAI